MFYQLEITTRCNFDCYYCAGRDMPQQDMQWDTFTAIVDRIKTPSVTVSLQGEGEPSLHPQFFEMARYLQERKLKPYTILNGSRIDAHQIDKHFPTFGVSIDTLDPEFAEKIGRHNLHKVLRNMDVLCSAIDVRRITIMTVDMGQALDELRSWVKGKQFGRHIVQPLSPKSDYARRYTVPVSWLKPLVSKPKTCEFLEREMTRFYTWQGTELPCVFMKNSSDFKSIQQLRASHLAGQHKPCCDGCSHLRPIAA